MLHLLKIMFFIFSFLMGISLVLFFLFSYLKRSSQLIVLIHELGHSIVAKILKIPIEYIRIGNDNNGYIAAKLLNTPVRFGQICLFYQKGSIGFTHHSDIESSIWRYITYAFGGVLSTALFTFFGFLSAYIFFPYPQKDSVLFLLWFIYLIPFLLGYLDLLNLVPLRTSDGWNVIKLLMIKRKGLSKIIYHTYPRPMFYQYGDTIINFEEGPKRPIVSILAILIILISLEPIILKITHGSIDVLNLIIHCMYPPPK